MRYPFEIRDNESGAVLSRHATRRGAERKLWARATAPSARLFYMGRPAGMRAPLQWSKGARPNA